MNRFKLGTLPAVAGCGMLAIAPLAMAQAQAPTTRGAVALSSSSAPACPYGYYADQPTTER